MKNKYIFEADALLILIEYDNKPRIISLAEWYGDINVLSYGKSQESIMRLNSSQVSNELLGSIK